MTTKIFKYTLNPMHSDGRVRVSMPRDAIVRAVQSQNDTLCLWAEVDPTANQVERTFMVFGTGHPIEARGLTYLGTAQLYGGALVLHVFEEP